jgi:hypothetical protein
LQELSGRVAAQIFVSMLGILLMVGAAGLISWYKKVEGRTPGSRPPPNADLAGGEA